MKVEFDGTFNGGHAFEHRLPERIALFGNAAFSMRAQRQAADGGARFEHGSQPVAAVLRMVLRIETCDLSVGVGGIVEVVSMGPDAYLEVHAAQGRFLANEAERIQISGALGVRNTRNPYVVAGNLDEKRIGEVEIRIAHFTREIVADPERQAEPVEAIRRQHRQVFAPVVPVVEPRLVFDFADEGSDDTANPVSGLFFRGFMACEGARVGDLIGEFEQGIHQAAGIRAGGT